MYAGKVVEREISVGARWVGVLVSLSSQRLRFVTCKMGGNVHLRGLSENVSERMTGNTWLPLPPSPSLPQPGSPLLWVSVYLFPHFLFSWPLLYF